MLEATLSLLALLSLSIFLSIPGNTAPDTSLYMYELQGDVKNVLYLKGGFEDLVSANAAAMEIFEKTGWCMEMEGTELTSFLVSTGYSSEVWVPRIKNGTLVGFSKDVFLFGPCANT